MKKRLFTAVLTLVLLLSMAAPAAAATRQNTADALNALGLFLGMGDGEYALEQKLTRAQGVTLLVRMIGKESQAQQQTYRTPFKDVPDWAKGYVGYAYTNKITNGMGPDVFRPDYELNDYMFLTLVLRALGYSDSEPNPQFVWNDPYALAKKVGLISTAKADTSFTRGDAVEVFWKALQAEMVGKDMTLARYLIEEKVFTAAAYEQAKQIRQNGKTQLPDTEGGTGGVQRPIVPDKPSEKPTQPETPSQPEETPDLGSGGLPIVP